MRSFGRFNLYPFARIVACGLVMALVTALFISRSTVTAEEPSHDPKPIPSSRPQIKQVLEALKSRQPRLPAPPTDAAGDWRSKVNNGRFRRHYLPASWMQQTTGGGPINVNADPAMTLTYALKTQCFWIVSRGNNCHYCLGHQELKLANEGLSDDSIAALDVDWTNFTPQEQAAFALARKMTLAPHTMTDADIEALREQFNEQQIVELTLSIANNNSTNRWTDSLGIPQDQGFDGKPSSFNAPTSDRFLEYTSFTAPNPETARPALESPDQVRAALSSCRSRSPRVELVDVETARGLLPQDWSTGPLPQWIRALAWFPDAGPKQIATYTAIKNEGRLPGLLKAEIAWTTARHNRAWYALGDALSRLAAHGLGEADAFALDNPDDPARRPEERAALAFARKLTITPHAISDADIAALREEFSDHEVAEIVQVTCVGNMFDRFTETLGLQLESNNLASANHPRLVPITRPEMKKYLEDMKGRTPRIPLPELTAEEQAQAEADPRSFGYEGRLRALYLPQGDARGFSFGGSPPGGFGGGNNRQPQESDPAITLDYAFKTRLFWIASRANNCQYCLGHQESKLLNAGMTEDEIAALDSDWSVFSPAEQAAFALARRLTLEPHLLSDADIDRCREHFSDVQILEMVMSLAGNNSINRWKEGTGVPQSRGGGNFGRRTEGAPAASQEHSYLSPTSEKFLAVPSVVASLSVKDVNGQTTCKTVCQRPALEPRQEVDQKLAKCATRSPRLPVVEESAAREALGDAAPDGPLPQWMRLLANFPIGSKRTVASYRATEELGDLSPLLKARISWVIARQDRAWYALGDARLRLAALGQSDAEIDALDGDLAELPAADRALLTLARNLAASPVVLTDEQVARAVELAGPRDVVQAISYTTYRASFDRITEAAGLPLEPDMAVAAAR